MGAIDRPCQPFEPLSASGTPDLHFSSHAHYFASQSPFHLADLQVPHTDQRMKGCDGILNPDSDSDDIGSSNLNVNESQSCQSLNENRASIPGKPFNELQTDHSCSKLVYDSNPVDDKKNLEQNRRQGGQGGWSRSTDATLSSVNCDELVLLSKDSPSIKLSEHAALLEPSKGSASFEPFLSAPSIMLMDPDCGKLMSSTPLVLAATDSSQPRSPGLQRAQTLPTGSVEVSSGSEKQLTKGDRARSMGGRLSKRKQKKMLKQIATVNPNGTVDFDMDKSAHFPDLFSREEPDIDDDILNGGDNEERQAIPPLQIAILIVGTRGDVQPFVAIGKHLQEYGHRVRLATHSSFREFVLKAGLEYFPLGGDPKRLAGYMVKNKGFLPCSPSEIRKQRKELKSIIHSLLPACIESEEASIAFRAQAIIANPPCYGHAHVAEYLKVPLHVFFTMPWTPTSEFPHPLSRVNHSAANRLSYQVIDSLIWWGIRDIINDFRKKKLNLRPITYLGGSQLAMSKVPTGYIWSPYLVPKPKDWGALIDVVGFCYLSLSQDYEPPESLVSWLKAGSAPVYVGFGSLPIEDPEGMTHIIVDAFKQTSQRGIIDKGWGGIGALDNIPDSIYILDNCPHDWLFPQCAAVVHHGGAGTTATGLQAGCPTTIVPSFGDQPFWAECVHAKGVGPPPIPFGQFSLDKLVHAINFMMDPQVKERAVKVAGIMERENGIVGAVNAFHKHLPKEMPKTVQSISSKTFADRVTGYKLFKCFSSP